MPDVWLSRCLIVMADHADDAGGAEGRYLLT